MGLARPREHCSDPATPQAPPSLTSLTHIPLDLSNTDALLTWLKTGTLTRWFYAAEHALLINNAGRVTPIAPVGEQPTTELATAIALNVTAPLLLTNAFVSATQSCPDRRILHISSGAARNPYAGWSAYCAAKAALDHHARSLLMEGHPGLRIESLAPGVIDTDMQADIRQTPTAQFPERQRFIDLKNNGGLLSPDAAAHAICAALLSDAFGHQPVSDIRSRSH